jgi:hypothetical protein
MTVAQLIRQLSGAERLEMTVYWAPYGATDWHDMERVESFTVQERDGEEPILVLK